MIKKILCYYFDEDNKGYVDLNDIVNVLRYLIIGIIGLVGSIYGLYVFIFQTDSITDDHISLLQMSGILILIIVTAGVGMCCTLYLSEMLVSKWNEIKYKKLIVCERKKDEGSDR